MLQISVKNLNVVGLLKCCEIDSHNISLFGNLHGARSTSFLTWLVLVFHLADMKKYCYCIDFFWQMCSSEMMTVNGTSSVMKGCVTHDRCGNMSCDPASGDCAYCCHDNYCNKNSSIHHDVTMTTLAPPVITEQPGNSYFCFLEDIDMEFYRLWQSRIFLIL